MNKKKKATINNFIIYGLICFFLLGTTVVLGIGTDIVNHSFLGKASISYNIKNMNLISLFILSVTLFAFQRCIRKYWNTDKRVDYIFGLLLVLSVYFVFCKYICIDGYYMFYDIGSDTKDQYFAYYINEVLNIRNGNLSIWNWSYGLGTSILNVNAWVMDPFGVIPVLLGVICGPGVVQYALVWMQVVKIIVLFLLGRQYFSYFLKDRLSLNIAAYLFAMNGYLILWGQHYFLGTACFYNILLLWAMEYYLYHHCKKGYLFLALAVTWTMIFSYYIGYMIAIVSAIYFVYRYFCMYDKKKSIKAHMKNMIQTIFIVCCGTMMSGVVLLPCIHYVTTNSSRLDAAGNQIGSRLIDAFCSSLNFNDLGSRLSRFLSNNGLYFEDTSKAYFQNYYESPILFCTVLIFLFLGQWMVYELICTKEKKHWVRFVVKCILLYLLIFNSATGFILNGFAYAAYRYTFLVMPFLALAIGIVYQEVLNHGKIYLSGMLIGIGLSIWAWGYSVFNCSSEVKKYVWILGFILVIGFFLLVFLYRAGTRKKQMVIALTAIMLVSTMIDNYYTSEKRNYVAVNNYPLVWSKDGLETSSAKAVDWIQSQDDSFYRIDKTYGDWAIYAEPLLEQHSSVICYNSTLNRYLAEYYRYVYPSSQTFAESLKMFQLNTALDQAALNVVNSKYLLSGTEIVNDNWKLVNQFDWVYVYQNMRTDSVAKWYTNTISKENYMVLSDEEKAHVLSDTVVVDRELSYQDKSVADIGKFSLENLTHMKGHVTSSGNGLLMIAIPYQEGWELYVDGEKRDYINCDYGFIGVELKKGSYNISVKYHIPFLKEGGVISFLGMLLLVIFVILQKKLEVKKEGNE